MKSRRFELSDIRYSDIKAFTEGNVVKCDFYHTGFLYILLSKKSIPKMRVDKYRCTDDLIIFMFSRKLCECLAEALPEPTNLIFQARLPAFRRADRQKERRKAKKKGKTGEEKEMNVISGIIKNNIPSPVKKLFPTFIERIKGGSA